MDLLARKSAPRAAFLSSLLFVSALITTRANAVQIQGCGTSEVASNRFIVRARVGAATSAETLQVKSAGAATNIIASLLSENESRLVHFASRLERAGHNMSAQDVSSSVVTVASELSVEQLATLQSDPSVLSVENDCLVCAENTSAPNDPVPSNFLWPRRALNIESAWAQSTDSSKILIAVSDTGTDLAHEDLKGNLWTNQAELHGLPEFDDDGNGCIDDIHGCDLADGDGDPSPGPSSEADHGTHVAGIIAAVGNNSLGATGISWTAKLLIAKGFSSSDNSALASDLLKSVYYAVNTGARVINCSWGVGRAPNQAEIDAFQYALAHGALPVVAAGNSAMDASTTSPAAIDGVLTVGSINSLDHVSSFSNFGSVVSVYAPGGDALQANSPLGIVHGDADEYIYSTLPTAHGSYGQMRGTSMAAPFITGLVALISATYPSLTPADLKVAIIQSSRVVSARLPNGATSSIQIPDAAAALTLASTLVPHASDVPETAPSKPSTPTSQAAPPPSLAAAGGCALAHESSLTETANRGLGLAGFFLFPIFISILLRRRNGS